jgi:hypothetical protein
MNLTDMVTLKEYRFYQFVVAYKKALENYYKDVVFD